MSLESFWRSTPRVTALYVQGYLRRRAWAAWHAGAAGKFEDLTFDELVHGSKIEKPAMSSDQMLLNLRRIVTANNAAMQAANGNG